MRMLSTCRQPFSVLVSAAMDTTISSKHYELHFSNDPFVG
jgi:hypothetical protein